MRLLHVVSSPADASLCDQNCEGVAINLGTTGQLSEIAESAILDALAQRLDADAVYGDIEVGERFGTEVPSHRHACSANPMRVSLWRFAARL